MPKSLTDAYAALAALDVQLSDAQAADLVERVLARMNPRSDAFIAVLDAMDSLRKASGVPA